MDEHAYRGPIRGVVFDWSGTTIDHGSMAPAAAFVELFRRRGIELSMQEARRPMGRYKLDHIRALLADPAVAERWRLVEGRGPGEDDARAMYEEFRPIQMETISRYRELIPGVREVVAELHRRGLRIGSTTGYWREATQRCVEAAAAQGYRPDAVVCPDDVPTGRPEPWMLFRNLEALGVYPPAAVVKVGDTAVDVEEARNAGAWSVGVTLTGNEVGLTREEVAEVEPERLARLVAQAENTLRGAGAHYVVADVTGVPEVVEIINERLAEGDRP